MKASLKFFLLVIVAIFTCLYCKKEDDIGPGPSKLFTIKGDTILANDVTMRFGSFVTFEGEVLVATGQQLYDAYGKTYFFEHGTQGWVLVDSLKGGLHQIDFFENTMAAQMDISSGENECGSVQLYERTSSGKWNETQLLKMGKHQDGFGDHIDLKADRLIVGAPAIWWDNLGGANIDTGSVYIFHKINGQWEMNAKFQADDASNNDRFGYAVAIEGDFAFVGTGLRQSLYCYRFEEGKWSLFQKLPVGYVDALALENGKLLVRLSDVWGVSDKVLAYNLNNGELIPVPVELDFTSFKAINLETDLSLKGNYCILGVQEEGTSNTNACYLMEYKGNSWQLVLKILAPGDWSVHPHFSYGMGLSEHWIGIGSDLYNGGGVYLYSLP